MAFHGPPPFGDPAAMGELAREAADGGAANIARLVEYGGRQALAADPDLRWFADSDIGLPLSRAAMAEHVRWLSHSLSRIWGVCACRALCFASWVDGTPELQLTDRLFLKTEWCLRNADWMLDLIEDGSSSQAPESALGLTLAELAGSAGSFVPLVGEPERHARALSIARDAGPLWGGQSATDKTELFAEQLEQLYLAYHRFCCRAEVLARCALAERKNAALGPMFCLVVTAAVAVVAAVEATDALRGLLSTSGVVADRG